MPDIQLVKLCSSDALRGRYSRTRRLYLQEQHSTCSVACLGAPAQDGRGVTLTSTVCMDAAATSLLGMSCTVCSRLLLLLLVEFNCSHIACCRSASAAVVCKHDDMLNQALAER